ncbi:sensor histidine kinase [Rubinisphaera italica]|nr:ATP-binding protein [Rubinisphaera italica]
MTNTSSDNSTLNDTEQELRARYLEIAELAGGLAHEIRNPLSTISLNLGVLREELDGADDPRDQRMVKRLAAIQTECDRLEDFLNDFLQFARVMELNFQAVDVSEFVSELIEFIKPELSQQSIEISPHLGTNLPAVQIDEALFRRGLLNLTRNAQQAMPDGGVLEFQTYLADDQVVLEIIDTGKGIPENVREKIFDPFFSTKTGGSGLGLPTVCKIIEAHQGEIQCASEIDKGTRFRITLPVLPKSD